MDLSKKTKEEIESLYKTANAMVTRGEQTNNKFFIEKGEAMKKHLDARLKELEGEAKKEVKEVEKKVEKEVKKVEPKKEEPKKEEKELDIVEVSDGIMDESSKAWDKLGITSGSDLEADLDKQTKLWAEYDKIANKYKVKSLSSEAQELLYDEFEAMNEHTLNEYMMLSKNFSKLQDKIDVTPLSFKLYIENKTKKAEPKKEVKKVEVKKAEPKKEEKFTLKIDGKVWTFNSESDRDTCQKAIDGLKAVKEAKEKHEEAREEGMERAKHIPVTRRIADSFISIAKKTVAEVPQRKIKTDPNKVKKELKAVETAFNNLFDKIGELLGKVIPQSQRKEILDILIGFEEKKIDEKSSKKTQAVSKKKEMGGFADVTPKNSWDWSSFLS